MPPSKSVARPKLTCCVAVPPPPPRRRSSRSRGGSERGERCHTASAWEGTSTEQGLACIIVSAFGLKRHIDKVLLGVS